MSNYDKLRAEMIMDGIIQHNPNEPLHRTNGPALTWDDFSYTGWALFGKNHRYYGAAATLVGGNTIWWIHGKHIK